MTYSSTKSFNVSPSVSFVASVVLSGTLNKMNELNDLFERSVAYVFAPYDTLCAIIANSYMLLSVKL